VEEKMIRKLLFALLAVLVAVSASAQVNQNYTFLRNNEGRPTFGSGLRPLVTAEMGIPVGTPFYDTSTYSLYYWDGTNWTAAALPSAGGTLSGTLSMASGSTLAMYNTADQTTNYERGFIRWDANWLRIGTEGAGGGAARSIAVYPSSGSWYSLGNFVPYTDDTYTDGNTIAAWRSSYVRRSIQGGKTMVLTDNTKTAYAFVDIAAGSYGGGDVGWTLECKDASDQVTRSGRLIGFSAQNTGGTETCAPGTKVEGGDSSNNAKVFSAVTFTCADGGTNKVQLEVQADCSIAAPTTLTIEYRLDMPKINTVTPGT
jgi:hypothetical protein